MAKLNLDKVKSERGVGSIDTVIATVDLDNGALVSLGEPVDGHREAMHALPPAADKPLLLIARPEVKYNQFDKWDELDIVTEAGTPVRGLHLYEGDKYQVEVKLVEAGADVNTVLTGDGTNYGYKTATGTEVTKMIIERKTKFGWDKRNMFRVRVL